MAHWPQLEHLHNRASPHLPVQLAALPNKFSAPWGDIVSVQCPDQFTPVLVKAVCQHLMGEYDLGNRSEGWGSHAGKGESH